VGLCSVGFEVLTDIFNRKSVYRTALLGAENAEGPKDTVEVNVESADRRNEPGRCYVKWGEIL
jgi:hypothetical protein